MSQRIVLALKTTLFAVLFLLCACSKEDADVVRKIDTPGSVLSDTFFRFGYPSAVILDTDIGSSTDDLIAMHILYRLMQVGQIDIKGIMVSREGINSLRLVDLMNTYYRLNIPIGSVKDGIKDPSVFIDYWNMVEPTSDKFSPTFGRTLSDEQLDSALPAVKLYRKILSGSKDHSVFVCSIGFATNLAQLLETGSDEFSSLTGIELVRQKVAMLSIQGGHVTGKVEPDYNFQQDPVNAQNVLDDWPTIILFSPQETGQVFDYKPETLLKDLEAGNMEDSPIYHVYSHYNCDTGQRMWDVMTIMQLISYELFTFDGPYKFYLDKDMTIKRKSADNPNHFIASPTDENSKRILMNLLRVYASFPNLEIERGM